MQCCCLQLRLWLWLLLMLLLLLLFNSTLCHRCLRPRRFLKLECLEGGWWETGGCVPVSCPSLPAMFQGMYTCTNGRDFDSVCTLHCPGLAEKVPSVSPLWHSSHYIWFIIPEKDCMLSLHSCCGIYSCVWNTAYCFMLNAVLCGGHVVFCNSNHSVPQRKVMWAEICNGSCMFFSTVLNWCAKWKEPLGSYLEMMNCSLFSSNQTPSCGLFLH